jgi:hypothetical protein
MQRSDKTPPTAKAKSRIACQWLDQSERYLGQVLTECSQADAFAGENHVESRHHMVLHRPFELAAVTGHVDLAQKALVR